MNRRFARLMALKRVFITVKIYPGFSSQEEETMYAAGLSEDGSWIRIAPLRFERRCYDRQYRKYEWIEMDLVRKRSDQRRETHHPRRRGTPVRVIERIHHENNWDLRKKIALQNVYMGMNRLIADARNRSKVTSLATFKPARLLDFFWEKTERSWTEEQTDWLDQHNLVERRNGALQLIRKLPYLFSYTIEDINGRESTLMIDDWELGRYFWERMERQHGDEAAALEDVRNRYFIEFTREREVFFFLNTVQVSHLSAHNPFFIAGTFYPRREHQLSFDFGM